MPFYQGIRYLQRDMRDRTLAGLKRLRTKLDDQLPVKTREKTLVLGTWNIRNFDDNRFGHGPRTREDYYYIAEIISHFDVLAVQEVCDDLTPLERVMGILGSSYDYIITDLTEGRSGNSERLGFIYDKHKVSFQGVAGELVLDNTSVIMHEEKGRQFSRTPFMCEFQSGWFKFAFSTVHIYFGSDSGEKYELRVKEIDAVAKFIKKRAQRDAKKIGSKSLNHVLVGDFNIKEPGSDGYNALKEKGFTVFDNNIGSNKDQTRFYDQISFLPNPGELRLAKSEKAHGVFQFFDAIYRTRDFDDYKTLVAETVTIRIGNIESEIDRLEKRLANAKTESSKKRAQKDLDSSKASLAEWKAIANDEAKLKDYYKDEWRTFRASDHLPLWVELEIDFSKEYLDGL